MANSKTKLSRLELFLMGKGPTTRAVKQMRKAAEQGKPAKMGKR